MNLTTKLQKIIDIQKKESKEPIGTLNSPISIMDIEKIELLLEEILPVDIKKLYSFANGQNSDGRGILFGEQFCSSDEIIQQLEFSRTLIKRDTNTIVNPNQSEKLVEQIVDFYVSKFPKHKLFGIKKSWYKIEFECGINSFGGPYLYATENTTNREREIFKMDADEISDTVVALYDLEKPTYKWDELKFVVYSNGKYEVERSAYDFDNEIDFTSTPKSAIQKKYFHYKWLPIFSDYGGNYIGIDLDPDLKGTKGQVINFGRDEQDMFVLAENLENLFDRILFELDKTENRLLNSEVHLHDTLKEMTINNCPPIFDIFKSKNNKTISEQKTSEDKSNVLENFDCYYLYGLTDNPFRQSKDFKAFAELYNEVIGNKGGIIIGSSFHPYQLVNHKGTTVWQAGYVQLYMNEEKDDVFKEIINSNGLFVVNPSTAFEDLNVWPDARLTYDENPIFSKYVPFVIPFLVYNSDHQPNWDIEIQLAMATKGHASEYVEKITNLTSFFMPAPSFILGFDKFEEANPSKLIDSFISCKKMLGE